MAFRRALTPFCWLLLFCQSAQAVNSYAKQFQVTLKDGKVLEAYVTKPAALVEGDDSSLYGALAFRWNHRNNSRLAAKMQNHAADFIDARSRQLGHVNDSTRKNHEREIWQLRTGQWPLVVITEAGHPERVLFTVAIAVSWGRDPLPYQYRFFRKGIEGLPQTWGGYSVGIQNFFDESAGYFQPLVLFDKGSGSFQFQPDLSVIFSQLPWATGRSAEIKFLMQAPGSSFELAAIAHTLITAYGLHRFAVELLPRWMRAQQVDFMRDPTIRRHFEKQIEEARTERLTALGNDPLDRATQKLIVDLFFDALKKVLWSPEGFQRHSAVSKLYAQVSEKMDETRGSLYRLFLARFNFPETPLYDFAETAAIGTDGVQTKFYELTMENFDLDMLEGLNRQTNSFAEGVHFTPASETGGSCPDLLIEMMGATHGEAFRRFKLERL